MYAVLWLGLLLLAVMLVTVRNFFGGIVIITGGVLFYLVLRYGQGPGKVNVTVGD